MYNIMLINIRNKLRANINQVTFFRSGFPSATLFLWVIVKGNINLFFYLMFCVEYCHIK